MEFLEEAAPGQHGSRFAVVLADRETFRPGRTFPLFRSIIRSERFLVPGERRLYTAETTRGRVCAFSIPPRPSNPR